MRSDVLNSSSNSYRDADVLGVVGSKRVMSFGGDCRESRLDSATTGYTANDIILSAGALDTSHAKGHNAALKILIDRVVFCCDVATGTTMVGNIFVGTNAGGGTWANLASNYNVGIGQDTLGGALSGALGNTVIGHSAGTYAMPSIVLPVATKYVYVCTHTAINHATNFDIGRWNVQIEYTVI